jgi:O-antigen/teichoic acid export membrane protein
VKIYRAVTLALMILLGVGLVGVMTAYGVATFDQASLLSLLAVVAAALIAGVAFSWRRYFPRRR